MTITNPNITDVLPAQTIANMRRMLTPRSTWQCINYLHPTASGQRVVIGGKSAIRYRGVKADGSTFSNGRLEFPRASEMREGWVRLDSDRIRWFDHGDLAYEWVYVHA